jgi:hypothetical protein
MQTLLLPESWVEKIWLVMRATYGTTFDRQWECPEGVDPAQHVAGLKVVWSRELGGFLHKPQAIEHALTHLPEWPPNLVQFAALCRGAPQYVRTTLPAPRADQGVVGAVVNRVRSAPSDPRAWIEEAERRAAAGEKQSIAKKRMLRSARGRG